jgi:outer membrane protein assembly factor BamA
MTQALVEDQQEIQVPVAELLTILVPEELQLTLVLVEQTALALEALLKILVPEEPQMILEQADLQQMVEQVERMKNAHGYVFHQRSKVQT